MRKTHRALAAVTAALLLTVGGVLAAPLAATADPVETTLTVPDTRVTAGDWGDGVQFTTSGYPAGATVRVSILRYATASSGDTYQQQFTADASGTVTGSLTPDFFQPELPGANGYPRFTVVAGVFTPETGWTYQSPEVALQVVAPAQPTIIDQVLNLLKRLLGGLGG